MIDQTPTLLGTLLTAISVPAGVVGGVVGWRLRDREARTREELLQERLEEKTADIQALKTSLTETNDFVRDRVLPILADLARDQRAGGQ